MPSSPDDRNASTPEAVLWEGSPSQWVNLPRFVAYGLLAWMIVPLFLMLWAWLVIRNTHYELTSERLILRSGVLNKHRDEVELYRIKDYEVIEPWYLRPFSLGHVLLSSSDRTDPVVLLRAIQNPRRVADLFRRGVEELRQRKFVREVDHV